MLHDAATQLPRPIRMNGLWTRSVLIGTAETLPPLIEQLAALTDHPAPMGCLMATQGGESRVEGLPVLGPVGALSAIHAASPVTLAVVSLPESMAALGLRVRGQLRDLGIVERRVTPLVEMLERPPVSGPGPGAGLDMVELIGRTPHGIDRRAVARVIEGKRVLITGAGGSIGSELARIAATFRPALLVLMERSENALFEVDRGLARRFPDVPRKAVLHDITDGPLTMRLFREMKPHAVFHAAAHKHVPLMEDHPAHAVTNNVLGTRWVADGALAAGAERFVMISSDKAVNPVSVMGGTKRLAEMYVQDLARGAGPTRCSMVRFGNVLGSACSVLPIWSTQMAEGGPLTVTDARMTRYFMTIQEAAALVMQSAAMDAPAGAAPVYVLDMGEPVRILDLARRFVTLNGFEPRLSGPGATLGVANAERPVMDIVFTGARPGEKLHEELAYATSETLAATPHPGIRAWTGRLEAGFDSLRMVEDLSSARELEPSGVVAAIRRYLPEMGLPTPELRPEGAEAVHNTNKSRRVQAA